MANPLPMLIAGAAALLLLGGNKKKTTQKSDKIPELDILVEPEDSETDNSKLELHEKLGIQDEYDILTEGIRKDRRGHFPWRVYFDRDGYHAQIMLDDSRFAPVQEEVGVSDSVIGAKIMLKNRFNELLLERYPNEKTKNDPAVTRAG